MTAIWRSGDRKSAMVGNPGSRGVGLKRKIRKLLDLLGLAAIAENQEGGNKC